MCFVEVHTRVSTLGMQNDVNPEIVILENEVKIQKRTHILQPLDGSRASVLTLCFCYEGAETHYSVLSV